MVEDRPVHELFTLMLDNGYYDDTVDGTSGPFMCIAINHAVRDRLVSTTERWKTRAAIREYIGEDVGTLSRYLHESGLPNGPDALRAVYEDWENRPKL